MAGGGVEVFPDSRKIEGILLSDGWHDVYRNDFRINAGWLNGSVNAVTWRDSDGRVYFAPYASIKAIRYAREREGPR